jgi:hypothetical membrane protein
MYILVVYALLVTIVITTASSMIRKRDRIDGDGKRKSHHILITGFFVFLVVFILMHWLGLGISESQAHVGGDYETSMIKGIEENIKTGFAPF